ncbi:MFS transporter [Neptuniibacter sp. 2_MG-2023]|uniref:MFS transporter n=1 Tax=Neptuniibacter sp. 2_MG-2023 TaxID=3062671 RepID=UPI0026E2277D|nr:MFS transporter [Neptuniibacter sp. 2_MG-2023]MDO6513855.1 MFS transporter [Neptuniibacter sp. 2_MG-2023]
MIEVGTAQFWRATLALCLGSFMVFSNVYITQPLLPMLANEFQITPLQASWSLTVTTLTLGISLLLFGPISDAIGRTQLMLGSMAGVVLCSFALSQVSSFEQLVLLRAIQGVCLAGLPAIAIAYMGDEFGRNAVRVAVGLYISGNTLGGIGGRLIGGFVGDWLGWQEAFALMSLISFICLSVFAWMLPVSENFSPTLLRPKRVFSDILSHLQNPLLVLAYIIGGLNFFIFINQYSYATFLLAEAPFNLPASLLGMLFLTYLSGTFGSAISGNIAARIPQPLVIALGCLVLMLGTLVTLIPSLWTIIVGFLISAFGFFVAHSSASSWVSQNARHARATASSIYLVFYYLGASSGGFYLDPFWHWLGWHGVVVGSLIVLTLTFILSVGLYLRSRLSLATGQGCG